MAMSNCVENRLKMDKEEREALEMTQKELLAAAETASPAEVARVKPSPGDVRVESRELNPRKKLGPRPRPVSSSQTENTRYKSVTGV